MITQDEMGRWSNRAEDVISLEPYDPRWAGQFETEHQLIRANVYPSVPLIIEHIGSTAVEGLPAKPLSQHGSKSSIKGTTPACIVLGNPKNLAKCR